MLPAWPYPIRGIRRQRRVRNLPRIRNAAPARLRRSRRCRESERRIPALVATGCRIRRVQPWRRNHAMNARRDPCRRQRIRQVQTPTRMPDMVQADDPCTRVGSLSIRVAHTSQIVPARHAPKARCRPTIAEGHRLGWRPAILSRFGHLQPRVRRTRTTTPRDGVRKTYIRVAVRSGKLSKPLMTGYLLDRARLLLTACVHRTGSASIGEVNGRP